MSGRSSGMRRNVCEDHSIAAVAALRQVFAEQPGRTDAEAQCRGEGAVVLSLLSRPRVQGAEGEEDRGSEPGGSSESGIRQVGLLGYGPRLRDQAASERAAAVDPSAGRLRRPAFPH